jgi:hypothetical protein
MKISIMEMRVAIHQTHDCEATVCLGVSKVKTEQESDDVEVYLFQVDGHPSASCCFAWGVEYSASKMGIPAVLMTESIKTADDAVRAWKQTHMS